MELGDPSNLMILTRPYYIGGRECGYCNGKKEDFRAIEGQKQDKSEHSQSFTIGCSVEQMNSRQYDELVNQGFRRSGTFLYKVDMLRGCCRYYTIRTDMSHMKITKPIRKTVNRFIRAILGEEAENREKSKAFSLESLLEAEQKSKRFRTRFEPSGFSREKFELFKLYQVAVHNDKPEEVTPSSFRRFLCQTPFPEQEVRGTNEQWHQLNNWVSYKRTGQIQYSRRVGPTHECYYLDDVLIGVSVLDFLPSGISSIYFIWHPDYAHLSLGTLSGIREILMCKELQLGFYYLGYYIEDCDKMRYKLRFGAELLDVCNEVYFPLPLIQDFIRNGRFYTVGEENNYSSLEEPYLSNEGHPRDFENSRFHNKNIVNIANELYSNSEVYKRALEAASILRHSYGVGKQIESIHAIPEVVPGLIPLTQIVEWFNRGILHAGISVTIFDASVPDIKRTYFGNLSSSGKSIVIDFIRLFGLKKSNEAIIIV